MSERFAPMARKTAVSRRESAMTRPIIAQMMIVAMVKVMMSKVMITGRNWVVMSSTAR